MIYKYAQYLENIHTLRPSCPPKEAVEVEMEAFHFVYEPYENTLNFVPPSIKARLERRSTRKYPAKDIDDCDGYGLSMFPTEIQASNFWQKLPIRIKALLGYKNIAAGVIDKTDGVITPIENNGHFNLHEFEGCDLILKFQPVSNL